MNAMNLRTATAEQLRAERARLTNMLQLLQRRRDSNAVQRGGRDAGFRRGASTHQQDREIERLTAQLAKVDAEIEYRDRRDGAKPDEAAAGAATPADNSGS